VSEFERLLRQHLGGHVEVSVAQVGALERHYELLVRWNRVLNLTAIRDTDEAVVRHYCECLFFASLLPRSGRILDFGSGAGFPGIPIAIARPACHVSLVESQRRKSVFLREATRGMDNVDVLAQRVEDLAGSWDFIVSRAVDPLEVLKQIPRLAPRIGLLVSGAGSQAASQAAWEPPVRIPWGRDRWALFGTFHVERA